MVIHVLVNLLRTPISSAMKKVYGVIKGVIKSIKTVEFFKMIKDMPSTKGIYITYVEKPFDIFSDLHYYENSLKDVAKYLVCTYNNEKNVIV